MREEFSRIARAMGFPVTHTNKFYGKSFHQEDGHQETDQGGRRRRSSRSRNGRSGCGAGSSNTAAGGPTGSGRG